jgi:prophage DNA circulation protein
MKIRKSSLLRNNVDLSTEVLARHWTKHLGATREEIAAAIEKVGDNVETVNKELQTLKKRTT